MQNSALSPPKSSTLSRIVAMGQFVTPQNSAAMPMAALRPLLTKQITWTDLSTLSWQQLDLHICDLSMIQIIDTSSPTAEKEGTQ